MTFLKVASTLIVFVCYIFVRTDQFRIPLPFGSIDIDKNPDGSLNFGTNSDINILGYGLNSGLNFTSRNGSFSTSSGLGATIVQNQTYGLNSSFDVDQQKGLEINSDVNLGNKSIHGGLGKEAQFVYEAANLGRLEQQSSGSPQQSSN